MASVLKDGNGWRIRFYDGNGDRKQIRLAGVNKATAEKIGRHVDVLNAAKSSNDAGIDRQTALWLADLEQNIHDKLSGVGLIEQRVTSVLGDFIAGYIERRSDVKPGTRMNFQTCERNLVDFFGYDKPLRSITLAGATAFRKWLTDHEKQAENTLRRRCGPARQFFAAAIKAKLIDENPFDGMPVTVSGSKEKERFISEAESQKILKACPDVEWRLIFSLCRYGGLRCPSEILPLTWKDILWDSSRIVITSPKTERYKGRESRVIPMFPELAGVLNEAYELAFNRLTDPSATVNGPVITRYRDAGQNLRTTFEKIVKRAGLVPWQKPFQNLRSTRETELMETYPSHVVVAWIGHSEAVARKHYLQTTDAQFEKAISKSLAPQTAPQACKSTETGEPAKKQKPAKLNVLRAPADAFAPLRHWKVTPQGLEPQHAVPETAVLPLHHGVVFSYGEPGWGSAGRMYQSILIM